MKILTSGKMKKEIIKPFDLAKAKAGAKLKTKDGNPVEIFKWDARGEYPIKGIVIDKKDDKSTSWLLNGLMHKLMDSRKPIPCSNCSINDLCHNALCPAETFGGEYFVELKVEK